MASRLIAEAREMARLFGMAECRRAHAETSLSLVESRLSQCKDYPSLVSSIEEIIRRYREPYEWKPDGCRRLSGGENIVGDRPEYCCEGAAVTEEADEDLFEPVDHESWDDKFHEMARQSMHDLAMVLARYRMTLCGQWPDDPHDQGTGGMGCYISWENAPACCVHLVQRDSLGKFYHDDVSD